MDELLIIDNATGEEAFMTLVEAVVVTATTELEILQALNHDGICNSLDYTIIDGASAEEACAR